MNKILPKYNLELIRKINNIQLWKGYVIDPREDRIVPTEVIINPNLTTIVTIDKNTVFRGKLLTISELDYILPLIYFEDTPSRTYQEKAEQQRAIHDVSCRYFDKNGKEVKEGDTIRFTSYDGIPNKEVVVRKDEKMNEFGIEGLYPPMMKYLEFVIIDNGN